ncbi:carbohydrate ABC transporter permease [Paenibacillus albus]|uniref:Carbohydrate ABC transporter permease n=1 Tax=Paenibacillus albus TaxID=2495582 RepID=A0A3Q8X948_9BACL|nr:carbohydrate ABC transporter permease [Paenibacillus albus]AZN41662.1 carbohydrate ABC transporter permease [Paenibacillus albus]
MINQSLSRKVFMICNLVFLIALSLLCVLPILNVLAVSFSSAGAAAAGVVKFWPVDFNIKAYEVVMKEGKFFNALGISTERLILGTVINMILCVLTAYPLSKESSRFPLRTTYAWVFVFTILFSGGLIPWYLAVKQTHLLDTIWALLLPGAVNVFNIILMLNFFRGLPKELEESSLMDGAGHLTTLFRIYIPISLPSLATVTLFTMVGHWNSWFDGLMLMKNPAHYPLATYLQANEIDLNTLRQLNLTDPSTAHMVSNRTGRAAQIFMTALPILLVYPFLQKYFVTGLVLGSVKE